MNEKKTIVLNAKYYFTYCQSQKKILPITAILTAVLLWGGSFASMRVAVASISPWSVMWARMIVALFIILPFTVKMDIKPNLIRKGDWKLLLPMVFFQPCLYFLCESYALRLTTSSQAGVISASVPLMVTIGAWLFLYESITKYTVTGLSISMTGLICLTLFGESGGHAKNPILGNTLEFCAMAACAINMILVKQLSSRYNPWILTALQALAGAIFFIPGLFILFQTDYVVFSLSLFLNIIFLGGFVTLGAFGLYNWGMSRIQASIASIFISLIPVVAVLVGWLILKEQLSISQCLSAIAVIFGVWVSQKSQT